MTAIPPPPELPGLAFERVLGSGGYSDVYLYRQQLPLRHVAVKVLKSSGLAEELRNQLTAEANTMAGLADHPNIVQVFSAAISSDGRPYIVMSYYSRPNLAVRAANERLGVAEVLRIGIQIASAVETAHRAGILHRDIKPANLLINQYGVPGLTDFGIAGRIAAREDDDDSSVSIPWCAPEVLYATGQTSVRSDVYSLAATLWHLLVGRSPFEVRGPDGTLELVRRIRDAPAPSTGRADVPDSLDRLLRQALAKDPRTRPASAIDLARGLQAVESELHLPRTDIVVITEQPVPAGPPHRASEQHAVPAPTTVARPSSFSGQLVTPSSAESTQAPRSGRRRVGVAAAAAAVVVAGLAVAGVAIFSGGSGGHGRPQSTLTESEQTQNAGAPIDTPPGVPAIVGKRAADGTLVFTWTYSAPLAGDTFQWRETRGGTLHDVAGKPSVTLPKPARPGTVCIEVRVVRADGSNASPRYSPEGCVG